MTPKAFVVALLALAACGGSSVQFLSKPGSDAATAEDSQGTDATSGDSAAEASGDENVSPGDSAALDGGSDALDGAGDACRNPACPLPPAPCDIPCFEPDSSAECTGSIAQLDPNICAGQSEPRGVACPNGLDGGAGCIPVVAQFGGINGADANCFPSGGVTYCTYCCPN
jgi:hypothetical protein